jgi:hypothetical protein
VESRRTGLLLAFVLAVAGFLAWSWPLAQHLSTHTLALQPVSQGDAGWTTITANDQNLSFWSAMWNARALARGDVAGVLEQGQCYPMPWATTLGEHLIEFGALVTPWWIVTGDPVASFNLTVATVLVIAACGMFLFLFRHTRSVPASLAGAIVFAFATPRLADVAAHPAVVGTHWIPWVLWSFDGALAGERGRTLFVFGLTLLLSMLVGSYPLLAIGIVGGAYGSALIASRIRHGDLDGAALARCIAAAAPAFAIVAAVLFVYATVQHEWAITAHSGSKYVVRFADYLPGGAVPVGIPALLGLPLLLLRGGASSSAVPGLVAAAVAVLLVATSVPLPDGSSWNAYEALASRFALLDSVRAPGKCALAVGFCLQALGMIGWSRLMQRTNSAAGALIALLLIVFVAAEVAPPRNAAAVLGAGARMDLRELAPPRARIDALTALGDHRSAGAVLDLPPGMMVRSPAALLDAVWHGHPTSACYNTFETAVVRETRALADRSHNVRGVAELSAAGFRFVIERPARRGALPPASSFPPPARLLSFAHDLAIWELPDSPPVHHDAAKLAFVVVRGVTRQKDASSEGLVHEIAVEVRNRGEEWWAAPRPVEPLLAMVTFSTSDGDKVPLTARGLLPLALSPGTATVVTLEMGAIPPAGSRPSDVQIGAGRAEVTPGFRWLETGP